VLGANDGLVSNFCLIMGVAGAGTGNTAILLTGFAGLVAGACSTALGEWLSVTNARELARTQIAKEADELEHTPDAERHELALIYQAKGLDGDEAKRVAAQIMRDKVKALDTLTREELGLDPAELGGNPWSVAAVSFCLFSPVPRLRCSDLGTLRRLKGFAIGHRLHDPCVGALQQTFRLRPAARRICSGQRIQRRQPSAKRTPARTRVRVRATRAFSRCTCGFGLAPR
jgi:hypothetical protein